MFSTTTTLVCIFTNINSNCRDFSQIFKASYKKNYQQLYTLIINVCDKQYKKIMIEPISVDQVKAISCCFLTKCNINILSLISIVPVVADGNNEQQVESSSEQRHKAWQDVNEHCLRVKTLRPPAGRVEELWKAEFSFLHHPGEKNLLRSDSVLICENNGNIFIYGFYSAP